MMICNCSMAGTPACITCQRYKEYLVEAKSITQLEKDKENYEVWQLLSKLLEQAGLELVPSERTEQKIADIKVKNNE